MRETHSLPIPAGFQSRRFGFLAPFLLALACAAAPRTEPPGLPLGLGESFSYRVSWAVLPGVGQIQVSASPATDSKGTRLLRIVTETQTRGLARLLLPFNARGESLFDVADSRLIRLDESSDKRSDHAAHTVTFDYPRHEAEYSVSAPENETRTLDMPPGYPMDLITSLLDARTWDLKPGGSHDALVLFEDDFYQLTIHALGYETVTTPLGTYTTVVLEPRMEKTPPKGMFSRGSTARVWISTDGRRLPVKFRVEFKVGAGTAILVKYQPPASP